MMIQGREIYAYLLLKRIPELNDSANMDMPFREPRLTSPRIRLDLPFEKIILLCSMFVLVFSGLCDANIVVILGL